VIPGGEGSVDQSFFAPYIERSVYGDWIDKSLSRFLGDKIKKSAPKSAKKNQDKENLMTKRKKISVKGIAKLDKNEMNGSKGAGCGVLFSDGQILYCTVLFKQLELEARDVVVSHVFYY
jgi:hypothetical protein